jgi:hypothetical protein
MADVTTLRVELDGRQATAEADKVTKKLGVMKKAGNALNSTIGKLGVTLSAALAVRKFIDNTSAAQASVAQLEAVIKSTGGAAGKTSTQLSAFADEMQATTTYGDEAVEAMQALLLTFTNIRGGTFDDATQAVLDMSTAMGTGLKESAIQVGKALNDPILGVSALSRVGVQFTESQKDVIKALVDTGDTAGAQAVILKELETQFAGSAEAARNTFGGALANLKNVWNDLFEASSSTTEGFVAIINSLATVLEKVGSAVGAFFQGIQLLAAKSAVQVEVWKLKWLELQSVWTFGEKQERLNRKITEQEKLLGFMRDAYEETRNEIFNGTTAQQDIAAAISNTNTEITEQTDELKKLEEAWGDVLGAMDRALAAGSVQVLRYNIDMALQGREQGSMDFRLPNIPTLDPKPIIELTDYSVDLLDKIGPLVSGIASMADGLDLMDDSARSALRGVSDLVGGIKALEKGGVGAVGGVGAIVGGIAGLISAFSGDEEKRIREEGNRITEENNRRLFEMTRALEGQGTTTADLGQVGEVGRALSGLSGFQYEGGLIGQAQIDAIQKAFSGVLDSVGIGADKFNAILGELGITLFDSAGRLIPDAIQQLIDATTLSVESMAKEQAAFDQNLQVRSLLAQGLTEEAAVLRQQVENEKELADARSRGLDVTKLIAVQAEEALAREREALRLAEEKAAAEAKLNADFAQSLADRRSLIGLEGDALAIRQKQIEQQRELNAAVAAGYTDELILQLQTLQVEEFQAFILSLEDVAVVTEEVTDTVDRLAESMAAYRQNLIEDIRVRELYVTGQEKEAQLLQLQLRQQAELAKAMENETDAATLTRLKDLQAAEYERLQSQLYAVDVTFQHTTALKKQAQAVRETTKAAEQAARVLNAPSGLRLSLRRWQASAFVGNPSADTRGPQSTATFNFGKEAITIQAAKGESGDLILDRVVDAANRRARAGGGNVFVNLREDV